MFLDVVAAFNGKPYTPPTLEEKIPWIIRHIQLSCDFKGEQWGMVEMRKHLAWYIKGIPHASEYRQKLITVSKKDEAVEVLMLVAEAFKNGSAVL